MKCLPEPRWPAGHEEGTTAIEYALIGGLVAIVFITALSQVGQAVAAMFMAAAQAFG